MFQQYKQEVIELEPIFNGGNHIQSRVCHVCRNKLYMGEKYWWTHGCRGYVNICYKCLIKLGEVGNKIKEYNDIFLSQPKRSRERKFKMMEKIGT